MKRLFCQILLAYCFINCCIGSLNPVNGENSTKAKDTTENTKTSQDNNKAVGAPGGKAKANPEFTAGKKETAKKASAHLNHAPILVPPPPPGQPSLLEWSGSNLSLESLNFYNEEELQEKLSSVRKQLADAQASLEENKTDVAEAKEKAERFVSLYSEGVVSRKELENAKKQVAEEDRLSEEKKGKVQDLKAQESAILRRLATFKKIGKSKQYPTKKKN